MACQSSKIHSWKQSIPRERPYKDFEFVWSNWPPSPNNVHMSQITSAVDQFWWQNFFSVRFFQWRKKTKIRLYQIDTLMVSNKVRNFGELGPSSKKMETEYMMLWSNWPPSLRIGLKWSGILAFKHCSIAHCNFSF